MAALAAVSTAGVGAAVLIDRGDDERAIAVDEPVEPVEPVATSSSTSSTAATTTTTAPPRRATLLFGGDVLIHQAVWQTARTGEGYDFSPMLAPIAGQVGAADVAICHLEVTLARAGEAPTTYPRFRSPPELAVDLAEAGFDGCSVASNHSLDHGAGGVHATLDALDAAGLGHAGTARSAEEDALAARYDAGGVAIAHLSYSYGFNGFVEPADQRWLVDQIDPAVVLADAAAARAAGAEMVVVSLHWGNEYRHDVTPAQQALAEAIAAQPGVVDLVVGHHAHVVQPVSKVGDLWVVWGMGNLLSNNEPGCCGDEVTDGVLVTVTIGDRDDGTVGVIGVAFTPTWNERRGFRVLPAAATLVAGHVEGAPLDAALAAELRASHERTSAHVLALDGAALGITPTDIPPP